MNLNGRNKILPMLVLIAAVSWAGVALKSHVKELVLTDTEKIFGLSLYWMEVKYNFAFFDQVPDLDWDRAYQEYIPKVLAAETDYEYYMTLIQFAALLKDGHTNIGLPQKIYEQLDRPAVFARAVERKAVIYAVDKEIIKAVPLGSEILEIDGIPVRQYLEEKVLPYVSASTEHARLQDAIRGNRYFGRGLLEGPAGSSVQLLLELPSGEKKKVVLARDWFSKKDVELVDVTGNRDLFDWKWLENCIAYIFLGTFNEDVVVEEFEKIVPELREKTKGIIFDIRSNLGGNTGRAKAILNHFTDKLLEGSKWKTREHIAVFMEWGRYNPDNEHYNLYSKRDAWHEGSTMKLEPSEGEKIRVPFVVLTSNFTFSAAEDFLIFIDKMDQATIVGEPTQGSTGQPISVTLPGGSMGQICAKRDTYPDGRDFVGFGVRPDIFVEPTIESFRNGTDPVFEKGLEVLKARMAETKKRP